MAREVEQQLGSVDVLVNNAGVFGPVGPIWETDADEWWHSMDVNLRGPWLCSQAVLPSMIARGRGCIISTASSAGLRGTPYGSAYVLSKTAIIRLSEILAV